MSVGETRGQDLSSLVLSGRVLRHSTEEQGNETPNERNLQYWLPVVPDREECG